MDCFFSVDRGVCFGLVIGRNLLSIKIDVFFCLVFVKILFFEWIRWVVFLMLCVLLSEVVCYNCDYDGKWVFEVFRLDGINEEWFISEWFEIKKWNSGGVLRLCDKFVIVCFKVWFFVSELLVLLFVSFFNNLFFSLRLFD